MRIETQLRLSTHDQRAEVAEILRETRATYQQRLADILAEQGVPEVWAEGE